MVDYSIQTCQHINSSLSVDFDFIAKTKYLQDKPLFLTLFRQVLNRSAKI